MTMKPMLTMVARSGTFFEIAFRVFYMEIELGFVSLGLHMYTL